jgi:hypothetical protein
MFLYTFYVLMAEAILYHYGVGETGTYVVVALLLCISLYEDTLSVDHTKVPESVMLVRIWACNVPLICASLLVKGLERFHFVKFEEETGPVIVGRPKYMIAKVPRSGYELVDLTTLAGCYYLYSFTVVATFRTLVSQFRYVKQLFEDNQVW